MAEDAAKQRLAVELPALPLARGGTLKDSLTPGSATQERIKKVIDRAITIAATPQTDGSWNVTLAVPIEAVRLALINDHGIRTMADRSDLGPPIVILEGVTTKPAVGQVVGGWAAAVLWMKDVPAWAADAPRIKATALEPGVIELPAGKLIGPPRAKAHPSVEATFGRPPSTNGGPGTLYIVISDARR